MYDVYSPRHSIRFHLLLKTNLNKIIEKLLKLFCTPNDHNSKIVKMRKSMVIVKMHHSPPLLIQCKSCHVLYLLKRTLGQNRCLYELGHEEHEILRENYKKMKVEPTN